MSAFNIARYQLSIYSPPVVPAEADAEYRWAMQDKRLLANLPAILEAAEEDLNELLPAGYEARFTPEEERDE